MGEFNMLKSKLPFLILIAYINFNIFSYDYLYLLYFILVIVGFIEIFYMECF